MFFTGDCTIIVLNDSLNRIKKYEFQELTTICTIEYDDPTKQYLGSVALGSFPNFNVNAKAWIPLGCCNTGYITNLGNCSKQDSYIRCSFTNSVSTAYVTVLQIIEVQQ